MRLFVISALLIALGLSPQPISAQESNWNLVFEDDFNRQELGDNYIPSIRAKDKDGSQVEIRDGELLMTGEGCMVFIARPFAMDVRLEFDARSWEGAYPCDLSVTLNAVSGKGMTYFLSFGGHMNTVNRIGGPGLKDTYANPDIHIVPGKTHRLVAEREGQNLRYLVDGAILLEATSSQLVGGTGFDHVGFVTWTGMIVDNVKVYERATPHPETRQYFTHLPGLPLERDKTRVFAREGVQAPKLEEALEALNNQDYDKAKSLFNQMDDVLLRLTGLAHILGDLNYFEKPVYGNHKTTVDYGEFGAFAEEWVREAAVHPEIKALQEYKTAVESFGKLVYQRGSSFEARMIVDAGPENNPFYYKAKLFLARYTFYDGAESGSPKLKQAALDLMKELKEIWPDHRVLREYLGPPVPWGDQYIADTEHHPEWAAYLREAYARQVAILTEFCEKRQMPDGQLGGGWGDDVEMLRSWVSIAAISSGAEGLRHGIDRLCEGIWTHVAVDGYDPTIGDVEHSAEPSADTFPTQLLLRHGDPLYHQWNLASCRTMLDVMLGTDKNGYPRFKSTVMGQKGVRDMIECGGDTGYHARAMKHFYWLAWYGNEEAKRVYLDWADGWRHATMLDNPDKPAGIVPPTLWYPSGDYRPPNGAPWYSREAHNYYGIPGLADMIYDVFLASYSLSGDRKFIRPYQLMMDSATWGPLIRDDQTPPSREYFLQYQLAWSNARSTSLYRMLTGESVYDEYTKLSGTASQLFQIDHDVDRYLRVCGNAARNLRTDLLRLTTETMATDRYWIPATDEVWGAYSGAIQGTRDARVPLMAVTYRAPSTDFAALVLENHPERVRLWFYSFWDKPTEVGLELWRLVPGEYILNMGRIEPGEKEIQRRYNWGDPRRVQILHQGEVVNITIPPGEEICIDLRLDQPMEIPEKAPDLAIHARDVIRGKDQISAVINNIGNAEANKVIVRLEQRNDQDWVTLSTKTLRSISEPKNFTLAPESVVFPLSDQDPNRDLRIVLDPEDQLFELCETNNIAVISRGAGL